MPRGVLHRRVPMLVIAAVVLFAFWRPLFAGATLAPVDQVWGVEPFASEAAASLTIESAPPDAAAVHAAWAGRAEAWRAGDFLFWDADVAGGTPVFRDGVPFTHLLYVLAPEWFAPGLVAAVAMLTAILGARDLARRRGATEIPALFAGLAYGCSGLLFVWFGWPHATALALVPWLWSTALAAARSHEVDRSGTAFAVVLAALLWCGVFSLAVLAVLGAVVLVAADGEGRLRSQSLGAGVAVGSALAAPHLAASWAHGRWADAGPTTVDSAADWATVLTIPFGSIFGNEAEQIGWFTGGSFQASVGFAGAVVVLLAVLGSGRALSRGRREAAGLPLVVVLGVAVAWFGGPFERGLEFLAGDAAIATHARVLVVLPLVVLAADGLALLVDEHRPRRQLGVAARAAWPVVVLGVVLGVAALWRWNDVVGAAESRRLTAAASMPSALAFVVLIVLVAAWRRGGADNRFVGVAACGLALFELLSFGMAIPTAADRDERLAATEVHHFLEEFADSNERIGGIGGVMAPAVSPALGVDDVRARARRSAELASLFAAADPASLRAGVGGSPSAPRLHRDDALESGVWSALGVDVLVAPADTRPPGIELAAPPPARWSDAVLQPVSGELLIPSGGIRGVVLDFSTTGVVTVEVEITIDGTVRRNRLVVAPSEAQSLVVPIAGDDLPAGWADMVVRVDGEPSVALIGLDAGATTRAGSIASVDDMELVAVDPILVFHRPTPPARFASHYVVEPQPVAAAALVDGWDGASPTAVLPDVEALYSPNATAQIRAVRSSDRLTVNVLATGGGLIVTDIPDAPGWRAEIDGRRVDIVTADVAFAAVWVTAGEHVVELRYRPPHLWWSSIVAMLGLGAALALRGRPGSHQG